MSAVAESKFRCPLYGINLPGPYFRSESHLEWLVESVVKANNISIESKLVVMAKLLIS